MTHFFFKKVTQAYHHQLPSIIVIMSDSSDHDSNDDLNFMSLYLLMRVAKAIVKYATPFYNKIPYHTSALLGEAWVLELLNSHPKHIHHTLGVHKHIFNALIEELSTMGLKSSQNMTHEEKLSIFLYKSVTGLALEHVGECFQHSNDTISAYGLYQLKINLINPSSLY